MKQVRKPTTTLAQGSTSMGIEAAFVIGILRNLLNSELPRGKYQAM